MEQWTETRKQEIINALEGIMEKVLVWDVITTAYKKRDSNSINAAMEATRNVPALVPANIASGTYQTQAFVDADAITRFAEDSMKAFPSLVPADIARFVMKTRRSVKCHQHAAAVKHCKRALDLARNLPADKSGEG